MTIAESPQQYVRPAPSRHNSPHDPTRAEHRSR